MAARKTGSSSGSTGSKPKIKIVVNSPVVLAFSAICVIALALNSITNGWTNRELFSVYQSSLLNPLTYIRFFGHVFGHSGVEHLVGNLMTILILGPILEDRYGGKIMALTIAVTAFVTGLVNFIFFPGTHLLGASGVVFAFILLASFTSFKDREIPLTFILVAVIYLGQQIYQGITRSDDISQLTHIIGGITGSIIGYKLNRK